MSTNWDRLANVFADHDARKDRETKAAYRREIETGRQVEEEYTQALKHIPAAVEKALARIGEHRWSDGQWVVVYSYSNRTETGRQVGEAVTGMLVSTLKTDGIETKIDCGGDELHTGWEVCAKLADLKKKALEHINRPAWKPASP